MNKYLIAGAALVVGSIAATGSEAATGLTVLDVSMRNVRTIGGTEVTFFNVLFDGDIGTSCTQRRIGTISVASSHTNPAVRAAAMDGVRQVALAALLSGRKVDVTTSPGCSWDNFHWIDLIILKK